MKKVHKDVREEVISHSMLRQDLFSKVILSTLVICCESYATKTDEEALLWLVGTWQLGSRLVRSSNRFELHEDRRI